MKDAGRSWNEIGEAFSGRDRAHIRAHWYWYKASRIIFANGICRLNLLKSAGQARPSHSPTQASSKMDIGRMTALAATEKMPARVGLKLARLCHVEPKKSKILLEGKQDPMENDTCSNLIYLRTTFEQQCLKRNSGPQRRQDHNKVEG